MTCPNGMSCKELCHVCQVNAQALPTRATNNTGSYSDCRGTFREDAHRAVMQQALAALELMNRNCTQADWAADIYTAMQEAITALKEALK